MVALIAFAQAVTLALIGIVAARVGRVRRDATATRQDTAAVRDQIVNDHGDINFRDENDRRHGETRRWWHETRRDIGGIREELRGMRHTDRAQEARIRRLEDIELAGRSGLTEGEE